MKTRTVAGRMGLVAQAGFVDVPRASAGRFSSEPSAMFDRWSEFRGWVEWADSRDEPQRPAEVGTPARFPRQVFAVGLNGADREERSGTSPHLASDLSWAAVCPGRVGRPTVASTARRSTATDVLTGNQCRAAAPVAGSTAAVGGRALYPVGNFLVRVIDIEQALA